MRQYQRIAEEKIKDEEIIQMKNGRKATKGYCSVCNTKVFRILKAEPKAEPIAEAINPNQ